MKKIFILVSLVMFSGFLSALTVGDIQQLAAKAEALGTAIGQFQAGVQAVLSDGRDFSTQDMDDLAIEIDYDQMNEWFAKLSK